MQTVHITDVILRDAHQSLIATRMRTEDMLPACAMLDQIGYWSLECWGGATFDACLRFLKEDPWERLSQLKTALPNTPLQMLLRGQNLLGYRHYSDDVVHAFVQRAAINGIDIFRIFDALNDVRNLKTAIEAVKSTGKHAQGTLCYTTSPVHDVNSFVSLAKELAKLGCDSIAIKDMAGLLTPYATHELVTALKQTVDLPIHLHSHATAGLAEMCQLKAIEAGCRHIDTALSSWSGGTSHPPTESLVMALQGTPYDTQLDLQKLQGVNDHFAQIRKKYHRFESEFTGVDTRVHVFQVPGGMISNLANQLQERNALDRINEVYAEIPRVRKDLGYPPLVTPTSQIVGTQAVLNILTGKRYSTITNEVKRYLQGGYGKAPAPINASLQKRAIGKEDLIDCRPADLLKPEFEQLRKEIGKLALNDEDVLSYAMFPEIGKQFLEQRSSGQLVSEPLEVASTTVNGIQKAPTEFNIALHGESYHIKVTGTSPKNEASRHFYFMVDGIPEDIVVETLDEVVLDGGTQGAVKSTIASKRRSPSEKGDVVVSMPCNVLDVLVKIDQKVTAGQAVLVTEAMKMETEITAPISGVVKAVHVVKGEAVNPNEVLIEITTG